MATIAQLQALLAASMMVPTPSPAATVPPAIIHVAGLPSPSQVSPTIPGLLAPPILPGTPSPTTLPPTNPALASTAPAVVPVPAQTTPVSGILWNPLPSGGAALGSALTALGSLVGPSALVTVTNPATAGIPAHSPSI
jgi:hypothetical protein